MEIVLAILLLFGGFTLGSVTADNGIASHVDGAASSHPITRPTRQSDTARCNSAKSLMYRDLTVPYKAASSRGQ